MKLSMNSKLLCMELSMNSKLPKTEFEISQKSLMHIKIMRIFSACVLHHQYISSLG